MLTVVLTNYNHARFLPFALDALLNQTRPADELIVIDDASKDNSMVLAPGKSYTRYWPFVPSDAIQATCASGSDTLYVEYK